MSDTTTNNENKAELSEEQKNTLQNGFTPSAQPSKEELEESHEEDDKKPAKEEDKPEGKEPDKEETNEEEQDDGKWKDQYVTFENPHAQAAVNLLKEAKVSPVEANDLFADAIKNNDLSKVDWKRVEKLLGPDKAVLFKAGVETYYNTEYSKQAATVAEGYEVFGGEEGWKEARKFFQTAEKKDPALKTKLDSLRKALDTGGYVATLALKDLKAMYDADPNTKGVKNGKHEKGQKPSQKSGIAITAAEFKEQLEKAHHEKWPESKVAELSARRRAGMIAGI